MKIKPKAVLVVLLIVLLMILVIQNTQKVTLRLFLWDFTVARFLLIPILVLIGFILGYVVGKMYVLKPRESKKKEEIPKAEEEQSS